MPPARIDGIAPFFIVSNVARTVAFYCTKLGFETKYQDPPRDSPPGPPTDPFFAIVGRDAAWIFLKSQEGADPMPNTSRHPWIKWDAYLFVPDPEALSDEFTQNQVPLHKPMSITTENLRGFEVRDPDGYVLFFGRPN